MALWRALRTFISLNEFNTTVAKKEITSNTLLSCAQRFGELDARCLHRTTRKKRTTHPMRWWTQMQPKTKDSDISNKNKEFLNEVVKDKYSSPLKQENETSAIAEKKEWSEDSKRVGLIARKIGVYPLWLKNGRRMLCTLLQVNDNHVIRSYTAEEFRKKCIYQRRWQSHGYGAMVVGAEGTDPQLFTAQYCGLFTEAGVAPKKKLTLMTVTDDALLPPGIPLSINHFRVGDYVDLVGKSVERGFQGVMKRWGFKGLPNLGTTKAHRRMGTIGAGRKLAGPFKGRKMPGHMGSKWTIYPGVKILRINTKYNVLYVTGQAIPGSIGSWVYVYDSRLFTKKPKAENPPPFPTYFPENSQQELPEDIYAPEIFRFEDPTIVFVETEDEKKATRTGAKLAKVRTKK